MTLYAKINENDVVENIIVAEDDFIKTLSSTYIKIDSTTGDAVIGSSYNKVASKFISPKPYASWTLNSLNEWESPAGARPTDGNYAWDEENLVWQKLELISIDLPIDI